MPDERQSILWVDDEIDLLRPHILYLESKGYQVTPVSNGADALELVNQRSFDLVLLDEMMPGLDGLAVLEAIKARRPQLPVIMITKSEEEHLMDQALGRKISDYLIKPVNPSQILLACKKIFEARELARGQSVQAYVRELGEGMALDLERLDWPQWIERYEQVVRWDVELDSIAEEDLRRGHRAYLDELNRHFGRFVESRYRGWIEGGPAERPLLSPEIVPQRVAPLLRAGRKAALVVIDCLRLDQWMVIEPLLPEGARVAREVHCAILPTATPYARNAIFSGLYPAEIARRHPQFWQETQQDDTGKNRYERELLLDLLSREGLGEKLLQYVKIFSRRDAEELMRQVGSFAELDLVCLVFTFVDTLTHGRSRDAIIAEFAQDQSGLRAHLRTWFERSVVREVISEMLRQGRAVVVTTDHGNLQVRRPALVYADREISSGVRFKFGNAPRCDTEQALLLRDPAAFRLPQEGLLKTYLFAKEDHFFVYPTRRHEYERQLRHSFQHGGISLEEMVVPLVALEPGA
ncbi:MAG: response regulator [Candidatus Eisenbacteria bacterium]|nr:response regulator [Candidatus Eisenbacteria bacterium]